MTGKNCGKLGTNGSWLLSPIPNAELAAWIEPVESQLRWRPQVRDSGDEMVLEAAINGHADAIVTFNVKDFASAGGRFGIRILLLAELLREIKP